MGKEGKPMKTRGCIRRRALAAVLAVTVLTGPALAADGALTRGETRDRLVEAAEGYQPGLTPEDVLQGCGDGTLQEGRAVTRLEALVMLRRAFGPLDAPDAYWQRNMERDVAYDGVPAWAEADVAALAAAGILVSSENDLSAPVTEEDLDRLVRRVWAQDGTDLKDDFFAAVNDQALNDIVFQPGLRLAGCMADLDAQVRDQIQTTVSGLADRAGELTEGEARVRTLYERYLDDGDRQAEGVAPLKPWLERVAAAGSAAELEAVRHDVLTETGVGLVYQTGLVPDAADSTRWQLYLSAVAPTLRAGYYGAEAGPETTALYRAHLAQVLELAGAGREAAQTEAGYILDYETALSGVSGDRAEEVLTPAALSALFPGLDGAKLITRDGFQPAEAIQAEDADALAVAGALFADEALPQAKAVFRYGLMRTFGPLVGGGYPAMVQSLEDALYGAGEPASAEQAAVDFIKEYLSDDLGRIYAEAYFPQTAKADVEGMVQSMLEVYRERIRALDWMGEATKTRAIGKLDAMEVQVGYPDVWPSTLDGLVLDPDDSLLDQACVISLAERAAQTAMQMDPLDRNLSLMPTYEVNAGYVPSLNALIFPAGILQVPFYSVDASPEANLGAIGAVIGHEISHAFDNNGAEYDEKGNKANWWTEEDLAAFEARCAMVEDYYDGWEAIPGGACDGALTLSENIADLGGMACALETLKRTVAGPDYRAFFRQYAASWAMDRGRAAQLAYLRSDGHSPFNLRVNRIVSCFPEFYEAFDVRPGDGMYVPPEVRVNIW